jgi:hypothetical protein
MLAHRTTRIGADAKWHEAIVALNTIVLPFASIALPLKLLPQRSVPRVQLQPFAFQVVFSAAYRLVLLLPRPFRGQLTVAHITPVAECWGTGGRSRRFPELVDFR